jgi:hypothetical protein
VKTVTQKANCEQQTAKKKAARLKAAPQIISLKIPVIE